jgi:hypothetical protein
VLHPGRSAGPKRSQCGTTRGPCRCTWRRHRRHVPPVGPAPGRARGSRLSKGAQAGFAGTPPAARGAGEAAEPAPRRHRSTRRLGPTNWPSAVSRRDPNRSGVPGPRRGRPPLPVEVARGDDGTSPPRWKRSGALLNTGPSRFWFESRRRDGSRCCEPATSSASLDVLCFLAKRSPELFLLITRMPSAYRFTRIRQ